MTERRAQQSEFSLMMKPHMPRASDSLPRLLRASLWNTLVQSQEWLGAAGESVTGRV